MSIINCPSNLLSIIISFLDNISNSSLMKTCKSINTHGKSYGFITSLKLDLNTDTMSFLRRFNQHQHTLQTVYIRGIDNPQLWLPKYTKHIIFDHCSVLKSINPPQTVYVTKSLKITDYHRFKFPNTLRINWLQFPNLENLELYVHDVDLTNLDLTKLKTYSINTIVRGKL